jgi:hypothetical protein
LTEENNRVAEAIIKAAHIISNNGAATEHGTQLGGLEAHSMLIAEAINNLADQIGRIADAVEEQRNA